MSKYTTTSILFLIILFALILQVQYDGITGLVLIIPVLIYLTLLIAGSVLISFNFYFKSLCEIKTDDKIVAITFDDGPHPIITTGLIKVLEKHEVKAAFFCIGNKIAKHRKIIEMIEDKGHLIGNHSFTHHRWFDLFTSNKMLKEITNTSNEIEKVTGKRPSLFRPPYGITNPQLKKAVETSGMISVGWSLRSFDTIHGKEKVMKKLKSRTAPGKIILFHDTNKNIVQIIDEYIIWLKSNGYKIVSLERMFNIQAYENK